MSRLDMVYRKILLTKFFTKGWGNPDNIKSLFQFRKIISNREICRHLVPSDYPIHIDKDELQDECRLIEGHFVSPFTEHLPGIMPKEVELAKFQMVLPKRWSGTLKPVCLHLAGTGDHGFRRRRTFLARPLLKESGIASILLENPFYGCRKPPKQLRSSLHNVSDLFVMGGALVLESLALFHWCEREGFGPLGITGISMGGHMASAVATNWHKPLSCAPCLSWSTASSIFTQMASLAATNWHKPLSLVPCLSWSTASSVFTQGVLSGAIPWKKLQDQFLSNNIYEDEITKMIHSPEFDRENKSFLLGQQFSKDYPASMNYMKKLHEKYAQGDHDNLEGNGIMNNDKIAEPVRERRGSQGGTSNSLPGGATGNQYSTMASKGETTKLSEENVHTPKTENGFVDRFIPQRLRNGFQQKAAFKQVQEEALHFMRGVMDECTHLGNFSVPVDPNLIIIVAATRDAYVPRETVISLTDLWPGAQVRYLNRGHIAAFLFDQHEFRKAITDSFDLQIQKYYS